MLVTVIGFLGLILKWVAIALWVVVGFVFSTAWVFSANIKGEGPRHAVKITWWWFKGALIWIFTSLVALAICLIALYGVDMIYELILRIFR